MLNDLKIISRKIRNDKIFSLLILSGLSLAFCVGIPLVCNIKFHESFDRFHRDHERIYNVYIDEIYQGTEDIYGELPLGFGEYIQELFPEVESMVRTKDASEVLISTGKSDTWKEDVLWIDPSFKDIFHLELLAGNKSTFLNRPHEVYISESLSMKIFGDLNSVGQAMKIDGKDYGVAGIFEDYPINSHQKFSALVSLKSRIPNNDYHTFDNYEYLTYIKLNKDANIQELEYKFEDLVRDYWMPWVEKNYSLKYVFNDENSIKLKLLPVSEIHLKGSFVSSFEQESNQSVIYINLAIVGILLLIAYFNLIGFAISRAKKQQSQLFVKRCFGASKIRIIKSFINENLSYTLIAFTISLLITYIIWRENHLIIEDWAALSWVQYFAPVAALFSFALLSALVSGLIVGILFAGISLKNKNKTRNYSGFWLNQVMLVSQMAASIILMVGVISIFKQIRFISAYNLGMDTENIVVINHGHRIRDHYGAFKTELKKSPLVEAVSCSNSYPFNWMSFSSYTHADAQDQTPFPFQYFRADSGFKRLFDIKITEGRWFSEEISSDENAIVLNEAAVRKFNLNHPIGETFYRTDAPSEKYQVIGVVKDFNFRSLHHQVEPLLLCPMKENDWWRYIEIKGNTASRDELIACIKQAWNKVAGNEYLDYSFLEDKMMHLYQKEQEIKHTLGIFSLVAILISCFGLLGTVLNATLEKTKEIGIRKINGATIMEIVKMLDKDFLKWVVFAFVIACPIAWYAMQKWLENFAYKTELSWWVFVSGGGIAVVIALLTVSWHTWQAASRNPIEALRYE